MAKNYDRWNDSYGPIYCGGALRYKEHWVASASDNPTWSRYSADSGAISVDLYGYYARSGIRWITPGQPQVIRLILNGVTHKEVSGPNTYNDCSGAESNVMSASVTATVVQTPSNPYSRLEFDVGSAWNWTLANFFSIHSDLGEYAATWNLGDNYKILPPTGLSATLGNYNLSQLHCEASISSWSNNTNIKGTPYTGSGGRTWNFMAEIKNPAGTVLYHIEKNTGETKSCSWDFTGMSLPVNTDLTLRIVVSNNYQQTQEKNITFKIKPIGKVITTSSEKWIFAGDRISSIEEGETIKKIIKFGKVIG